MPEKGVQVQLWSLYSIALHHDVESNFMALKCKISGLSPGDHAQLMQNVTTC